MAGARREAHAGPACSIFCPRESSAGDFSVNDDFSGQGFVQEAEPPEEEAQEQVALQLAMPGCMSIVLHKAEVREGVGIIFESAAVAGCYQQWHRRPRCSRILLSSVPIAANIPREVASLIECFRICVLFWNCRGFTDKMKPFLVQSRLGSCTP